MLEELTYLKLTITLKACQHSILPGYHGSMLRGVVGVFLRKNYCKKDVDTLCENCKLRFDCGYNKLFNGVNNNENGIIKSIKASNPFIIEPIQLNKREFNKGEELKFHLILLGEEAIKNAYQYIYAFQQVTQIGLGKRNYRFILTNVFDQVSKSNIDNYLMPKAYKKYNISFPNYLDEKYLIIDFLTPTRIKEKGQFVSNPTFETLIKNILRKGRIIAERFNYNYEYDYKNIIKKAKEIEIVSMDIYWSKLERYSSKNNKQLSIGGFKGKAIFHGDFNMFYKWIHLMSIIHVGKNTTTGGGRVVYKFTQEI